MEKHQVNAKPFVADPQSLLPSDKGKFVAEFEQERFKVSDQCVFQFALGVFVFEAGNSSSSGLRISSSAETASSAFGFSPFTSIADLFFDSAVRS